VAHPSIPCIRLLLLHVWFLPSLKMETAVFSIAWVPIHHMIRCHILEDYSCKDISCFQRILKFVTMFMGTHTQIMSKLNSLHSYTPCLSDFHLNLKCPFSFGFLTEMLNDFSVPYVIPLISLSLLYASCSSPVYVIFSPLCFLQS